MRLQSPTSFPCFQEQVGTALVHSKFMVNKRQNRAAFNHTEADLTDNQEEEDLHCSFPANFISKFYFIPPV